MEFQEWIDKNIYELNELIGSINCSQFNGIAEQIIDARKIFVFGAGRTGLVMQMFAMRLMQLGLKVFVVASPTTPSIQKDDLLIVSSKSGCTRSVIQVVIRSTSIGAMTASITLNNDSELSKVTDKNYPITFIQVENAFKPKDSVMPLGTIFEQSLLVLLDSLCAYIAEKLGQSENDMQSRHSNLE